MKEEPTVSFPLRMPGSLAAQIKEVSEISGLSQQDVMRLAMRIGLTDLNSLDHDLVSTVKEAVTDQGLSFADWAKEKKKSNPPNQKPNKIISLGEHLNSKVAEDPGTYGKEK